MSRHFDNWLKAYINYTRISEAPTAAHWWTGVSTIAGALRRRVWRDELVFKWRPNFYIILVAPPGVVTKSTVLNIGMDLLRKVPGIYFGPDSGSWQGLADAMAEATEFVKYTNGSGVEQLLPMSPVTVAASELGTFFHPDNEEAMSFITDMWDGRDRPYLHKTKHSGKIEIQGPFLNLIGAVTPSWLGRNFPNSLIGEGLTSRIVFVFADKKRHLISLPSRMVTNNDHYRLQQQLVDDLQHISTLTGPYEFTDEVYRKSGWMDQWYEKHNTERPIHLASDRYGGYLARKQGHMVKLAMVLAAAKRDILTITKVDLEEAHEILTESESSMLRVFESIGVVDEARHVAEIVAVVRVYKWITPHELYYNFMHNIMQERDFKQATRLAIEGGLLTVVNRDNKRGLAPAALKPN